MEPSSPEYSVELRSLDVSCRVGRRSEKDTLAFLAGTFCLPFRLEGVGFRGGGEGSGSSLNSLWEFEFLLAAWPVSAIYICYEESILFTIQRFERNRMSYTTNRNRVTVYDPFF